MLALKVKLKENYLNLWIMKLQFKMKKNSIIQQLCNKIQKIVLINIKKLNFNFLEAHKKDLII